MKPSGSHSKKQQGFKQGVRHHAQGIMPDKSIPKSSVNKSANVSEKLVKLIYYILLIIGIAIRLIPYIFNRSLWYDEAKLSLNITDRSFTGLLHPLDYGQVAPILFLIIEKANIVILGNSEYSLRLFPLLCGLLSLPLIYRLTKSIAGNSIPALIALFIFSTSPDIIYYCGEVKQYECDVFSTLVLLNLVFDTSLFSNQNKRYILLAIAGTVLIFMSNITVLVLFSIGIYYLFKYGLTLLTKHRKIVAVMACWIIAFAVNYLCFLYHHPNRVYQDNAWKSDFMPLQIFSSVFTFWIYEKYLYLFKFYTPFYEYFFLIAIVFFTLKKQWLPLFFLLFPLCLHFVVSGFKLYPFYERLILYLTAFVTPALSIAIFEISKQLCKWINKYLVLALGCALVVVPAFLVEDPFWQIFLVNNRAIQREEIKNSLDFIKSNISPGQKVYVYYGALYAAMYYEKINYISFDSVQVFGTSNRLAPQNYINEIQKMDGEVWLLFSHDFPFSQPKKETFKNREIIYYSELDFILKQLVVYHNVQILREFKTSGSAAFLVKIVH